MNKSEAIELLVNDKIDLMGYIPTDEFNEYRYQELRACFILLISGKTYYPKQMATIYEMVMRSDAVGDVDEKAKKSLIRFMEAKNGQGFSFLNKVNKAYC